MAAEKDMRSNRYAYIRQLYIDELKYDKDNLTDKEVSPRKLSDIKRKIRKRLKREARIKFSYAAIFTLVIIAVLVAAIALFAKYY